MRVLMLGPYPIKRDKDTIKGGVQGVVVNMLKGLTGFSDLDLHIITASNYITRAIDFNANGLSIHAVPSDKRLGNITLYRRTRSQICKKIEEIKPDLIHTHTLGYYTLASLQSGHKRVIVNTHGMPNRNWMSSSGIKHKISEYMRYRINKECMRGLQNVIVNSPYSKGYLYELKGKNIYELDNPISESFFEIGRELEEEKRILFTGNIYREKGIMTILGSLKRLKDSFSDVKLMLAGQPSSKSFYKQVIRFIEDNGLAGHVNFLGHLTEKRLKEEYAKASIFVFPSERDVAPLALLQAMASGKAIVASKVGGIPYIIDDGINGFLVDPKDPILLSEKIERLIKNRKLREEIGANAKKKASENNRIDKVTDKLSRIYREIAR